MKRQTVKTQNIGEGPHYNFQGYPSWYSEQLAKHKPIALAKFNGDLQKAVSFYYKQLNKLFFANKVLNTQLKAALEEKEQLAELIGGIQQHQKDSTEDKKKRVRRCASQIERKYICPVKNCEKSYGTEGSMAQHMRLKHPEVDYNPLMFHELKQQEPQIPRKHKKEELNYR